MRVNDLPDYLEQNHTLDEYYIRIHIDEEQTELHNLFETIVLVFHFQTSPYPSMTLFDYKTYTVSEVNRIYDFYYNPNTHEGEFKVELS